MGKLIRRLFGGAIPPSVPPAAFDLRDANPVAGASISGAAEDGPMTAATALEGEEARPDYEAFCVSFCFRPGTRLMDFLQAEGVTQLQSWLHGRTPEAEPKAFIRLMLELMRRGQNIWDQPGISLFLDGHWSLAGGPTQAR
jgi:hypothetical protein